MADKSELTSIQDRFTPVLSVDPNYLDLMEQCDSLRRSNLQLREEILLVDRENNELKKKTKPKGQCKLDGSRVEIFFIQ